MKVSILLFLTFITLITSDAMHDNAYYIYTFFTEKGWSLNSISAVLGNMQAESNITFDIDNTNENGGYGLLQWNPKSILVDWANTYGLDYKVLETQCSRILWELENDEVFQNTTAYPITFREFSYSYYSPSYLAKIFLYNYFQKEDPNEQNRLNWASKWYNSFRRWD